MRVGCVRTAVAVVIGMLAIAGCRSRRADVPLETVLDLIAAFPAVGDDAPTRAVDVGAPAGRLHFLSGWEGPVEAAPGGRVMWATDSRARVWFRSASPPVEQTAVLDLAAGDPVGAHAMLLVLLNGKPAGWIPLGATGPQRVQLPAAGQLQGRNILELQSLTPSGGPVPAHLFGVLSLRFESSAPVVPAPEVRNDSLVLPAGTSVGYALRLPAGARLAFESDGRPPQVSVEPAEGTVRQIDVDGSDIRVELGADTSTVARVRITARGEPSVLRRPRIMAPRPAPPAPPAAVGGGARPNVILYVADTLRADRLGCYGFPGPSTPHLDAFARDALLFEHAVAQSSWTRTATASIMTGRNPPDHGALALMDRMRADVPTMAELLKAAGYATAAFVTNLNVDARFGFGRGFDDFRYFPERDDLDTVYVPATELNVAASLWLEKHRDRPFFLWLHATDAHAPYRPPAADAARFRPADIRPTIDAHTPMHDLLAAPDHLSADDVALLLSLYTGEVAVVDAAFGALQAELTKLGLDATTLVVFVADHGEEFREHGGLEHGGTLFDEVVHVPLLVRLPSGRGGGRRIASLARQIDLLPTVLGALGLAAPADLSGAPLVDAGGEAREGTDDTEAEMHTAIHATSLSGMASRRWKVVWDELRDRASVYDLRDDPGERRDAAATNPVLVAYAEQSLQRRLLAGARPASTKIVDPEAERRLRALGYLGND